MAIVFNGVNNLLSWAGNIRGAFPITLFCWIKRNNTDTDQYVFGPGGSTGFVSAKTLGAQYAARAIYLQTPGFSSDRSCVGNTAGWSPIMLVVTATNILCAYGTNNSSLLSASNTYSDTLSTHSNFTIGGLSYPSPTPWFIGEISDVAVWNTALGDTEWNTLKAGIPPEDVASGSLIEAWALRELGEYTGVNGRTLVATGTLARSSTDPFTRTTAASASLSTTLDPAVFSGTASVSPVASLSISTAAAVFSGYASVSSDGVLTLPALKNNTGTVLASETGATVHVYATTGAHVVTKTGQTTNGSGVMSITDPLIVASTQYRVVIVLASGDEGMDKVTAA